MCFGSSGVIAGGCRGEVKKAPQLWCLFNLYMAVREGVEPSKPYDLHTFQACSFGHSDTSPVLLSPIREGGTLYTKSGLKAIVRIV